MWHIASTVSAGWSRCGRFSTENVLPGDLKTEEAFSSSEEGIAPLANAFNFLSILMFFRCADEGRTPRRNRSTIEGREERDSTIPSPGMSPEQPLQGTGLHDPLHARQSR